MAQQPVEQIDRKHRPVAGDRGADRGEPLGPRGGLGWHSSSITSQRGWRLGRPSVGRVLVADQVQSTAFGTERQQTVENAPGRSEVTAAGLALGSIPAVVLPAPVSDGRCGRGVPDRFHRRTRTAPRRRAHAERQVLGQLEGLEVVEHDRFVELPLEGGERAPQAAAWRGGRGRR